MISDKKCSRLTSFTITKSILVRHDVQPIVANLELLKTTSFNHITIPEFSYTVDDQLITIESEFIKGNFIDITDMDVLYSDLVMHPGDYSFKDYQFSNYIRRDEKIYAVDVDDFCKVSVEDRIKDWNKIKTQETERIQRLWKLL